MAAEGVTIGGLLELLGSLNGDEELEIEKDSESFRVTVTRLAEFLSTGIVRLVIDDIGLPEKIVENNGKVIAVADGAYAAIDQINNTDQLTEGDAKFFSEARALASVLAGLDTGSSAIVVETDSVLVAIGKLQAQTKWMQADW